MRTSVRTGSVLCRRLGAFLVLALGVGIGPLTAGADAQSVRAAVAQNASTPALQTTAGTEAPAMQVAAGGVMVDSSGIQPGTILKSVDALHFAFAPRLSVSPFVKMTQANASAEAQGRYRGRRGRGDRAVAGLVLGAIGGFAAGGAIGVAVAEHYCTTCSDPAFHGFIIGAPIGAFVGGMLGYAIAR